MINLIASVASASAVASAASALASLANNISHCFICTRRNNFTSISNSAQAVIYNATSTLEDSTTNFTRGTYEIINWRIQTTKKTA
jgi:hypothetical protein